MGYVLKLQNSLILSDDLTEHDRLEVRVSVISGVWGWMVDKMEKLTENMKEYKRKWEAEHKELRRKQNLAAVKRYQEKLRNEDA